MWTNFNYSFTKFAATFLDELQIKLEYDLPPDLEFVAALYLAK